MKRRKFLEYSSAGVMASVNLGKLSVIAKHPVNLAEENENILVIIQLFGGNDGLNTIIPVNVDSYYSNYRKSVNIKKSEALPISNADIAMHPSLKIGINEGLYGLLKADKLAIIQGIGYANPSFSHFRSSDIWLSSYTPQSEGEALETGWLGRYFDKYATNALPSSPYAIHIGNSPSLIFQGKTSSAEVLLENPDVFFEQGKDILSTATNNATDSFFTNEYNFIKDISVQSNHFSKTIKDAFDKGKNAENYADTTLSNQLKLAARLIAGELKTKIYFVSMSGFDTHSNQGGAYGGHATLLAQVSEGISAFMSDLQKLNVSKKVVGITISEFGRRIQENLSFGTDHGTASVMFAFGDNVKGKTFGKNLLASALTADQKNLVYQYDYRRVYGELLTTWFGASKSDVQQVLGGSYDIIEDGILKTTKIETPQPPVVPPITTTPTTPPTTVITGTSTAQEENFSEVFPNPTTKDFVLKTHLISKGLLVITQYDMAGRNMGELYRNATLSVGKNYIPLSLNGSSGSYILQISVNNKVTTLRIMKI